MFDNFLVPAITFYSTYQQPFTGFFGDPFAGMLGGLLATPFQAFAGTFIGLTLSSLISGRTFPWGGFVRTGLYAAAGAAAGGIIANVLNLDPGLFSAIGATFMVYQRLSGGTIAGIWDPNNLIPLS